MTVSLVPQCGSITPNYTHSMSGDSQTEEPGYRPLESLIPRVASYLETWMVVLLTMRISQYLPYFRKASPMNSEGVLWPRVDRFISFPNSISMRNSWLFTAVWAGRFHQGSCKVYGNIPGFLNSRRITQYHKQIL